MSGLADTFMKIMDQQPLSLALCVMNLLLLWYCFKITSSFTKSRGEAMTLIVSWQEKSQAILADSISKDSLNMILGALERDRETYRAMLPTFTTKQDDPATD